MKLYLGLLIIFDAGRLLASELLNYLKNFRQFSRDDLSKLVYANNSSERKVLFVSLSNSRQQIKMECLFARYFNEFGWRPIFLTNLKEYYARRCFCQINGRTIWHNFVYLRNIFKINFDFKIPNSGESLKNFSYDNTPLGKAVYANVCRKYKVGFLDFKHKNIKRVVRRFLLRTIVYYESAKDIIRRIKPDLIIATEKGYVANSEIFYLAINSNIDFIQWVGCQSSSSLIFKRYNCLNQKDHPYSISRKTWNQYINADWDIDRLKKEVISKISANYLVGDWIKYNRFSNDLKIITRSEFVKKYDLDESKKIVVLFSHVLWDANLFYGDDLFEGGFEEWFVESVAAMAKNKTVNYLVKIHPANRFKKEIEKIKSSYREIEAISEKLGSWPDNVKIILPEDDLNPLSIFQFIDCGITVRGTIGIELPCFGVPVITAGTGRYTDLGFTVDPGSRDEYLQQISTVAGLSRLSEIQLRSALIYAFLFFESKLVPFNSFVTTWSDKINVDLKINLESDFSDIKGLVSWAEDIGGSEDLLDKKRINNFLRYV